MFLLRDERPDWYEGGFENHRRAVNVNALRIGIVITVLVQVPFLLFEWLALREDFFRVQALRALWLGPAVALYPLLKRPTARLFRHVDGMIWLIYVASAAYIVVVAFLHEGYQSPYIHGLILMFVGVGAVTLWPWWLASLFAAAIYAAYWTPLLIGRGTISDLTNWIGYQCFMIGTMGIVLISQQLRLEMARADFERRCQLHEEQAHTRSLLERVGRMRQERLTWLESLARFLRHELKNQIVAVGTSIDLAQNGESLDANRIYLDRAQQSLRRMRGLVSSATEATSLEAALEADESERVDWSAVVVDRVSTFQLLHPSQRLTMKLRPGLSLDGNEERLAQLLDKLLSNAMEHSRADAEIRVELQCMEAGWIELAVENEGDVLPKDKERIFEAFVSSQKTADNLGLGLFVAQSIAHNQGGHIHAEDLPQGRGARFVVRLPESRPAHRDRLDDDSPALPTTPPLPEARARPRD